MQYYLLVDSIRFSYHIGAPRLQYRPFVYTSFRMQASFPVKPLSDTTLELWIVRSGLVLIVGQAAPVVMLIHLNYVSARTEP